MTITLVDIFVPGRPKTKGSLDFLGQPCTCSPKCKGFLRGNVRENVVGSSRWRAMVAKGCQMSMSRIRPEPKVWETWGGPVAVSLVFVLPAKSATAVRAGDIDKLARNVLDAMQDAKVYTDDVCVVRLLCEKRAGDVPGVHILARTHLAGRDDT